MVKVALTNESFTPQFDGVAVCVQNYAKIINSTHGQSTVIVPEHEQRKGMEFDFPVFEYPSTKIKVADQYRVGFPVSPILRKKISELDIDVVHSHCPFVSGIIAQRVAAINNVPHISTFHSKFKDDVNQRLKMDLELPGEIVAKYVVSYYKRCDYVWAVSNGTANTLREYGYKGEITVMPNGCDMPIVHSNENTKANIASEYGLDLRYPIFLFVGRITFIKNIDIIISALGALARHGKKFNMLFVGSGEDLEKSKEMVKENGIQDMVKFAGKVLDREKLKDIYSSSDLFIFPSVYDNAPLVVREAAACGCASLLIKDSNSAEGVIDGYNGFLAKDTVEDVALSIDQALRCNELDIIGDKARDTIYVSWDVVVERVVDEYKKIIDEWGTNKPKREKYFNSFSSSYIDLINDFNLKKAFKKHKNKQ